MFKLKIFLCISVITFQIACVQASYGTEHNRDRQIRTITIAFQNGYAECLKDLAEMDNEAREAFLELLQTQGIEAAKEKAETATRKYVRNIAINQKR